ncbi:MAG: hypothetical protein LHV69_08245 [Elusimicrobia bacterium]|nr:hypothetical protein [Candidatus Obscuribacterium magneticum]
MKRLIVLLMAGVFALAGRAAYAAMTFDVSHAFQVFSDDRWEGSNNHFGFGVDVGGDVTAGYFFEEANWDWRGDVGEAVPNFVNTSAHLNGLRLMKQLNSFLATGIDLGTAQIAVRAAGGTTATVANAARLSQTKPFVDLLGRVQYLRKGGGTSTGVFLDIGYRFLDLNDVAAAGFLGPAGERTLDDLNALLLGLGVQINF